MKISKMLGVQARLFSTAAKAIAAGALLSCAAVSSAAEIKVLSAAGIRASIDELLPAFEKASKHKVAIKFAGGGGIAKNLKGPEDADVVIIPQRDVDTVVKNGKAAAANIVTLARTQIGVAVRKGVAKPDISSVDAFKSALLAAKSVAYNKPEGSGSGAHIVKMIEKLGITKEINAKLVLTEAGGTMGKVLADGKAELGITQMSTYVGMSDIEIVGPIPRELQLSTAYVAVMLTGAKNADAAKALLQFLRSAEAAKVYKAKGMEPG